MTWVALLFPGVLILVCCLTMQVGRSHEEVASLFVEEGGVFVYLERARCVHRAKWIGVFLSGLCFIVEGWVRHKAF